MFIEIIIITTLAHKSNQNRGSSKCTLSRFPIIAHIENSSAAAPDFRVGEETPPALIMFAPGCACMKIETDFTTLF